MTKRLDELNRRLPRYSDVIRMFGWKRCRRLACRSVEEFFYLSPVCKIVNDPLQINRVLPHASPPPASEVRLVQVVRISKFRTHAVLNKTLHAKFRRSLLPWLPCFGLLGMLILVSRRVRAATGHSRFSGVQSRDALTRVCRSIARTESAMPRFSDHCLVLTDAAAGHASLPI